MPHCKVGHFYLFKLTTHNLVLQNRDRLIRIMSFDGR